MPEDCASSLPPFRLTLGQGPRPVLAIHCSLSHSGAWMGMAAHLPQNLRLTAIDLPGHGRSPDWGQRADRRDFTVVSVDMARAVMAELSADGPVDVIGHSFGGVVALAVAAAMPDRVRTLTLIEPVLFALLRGTDHWPAYRAAEAPFHRLMAEGRPEQAARAFVGLWGAGAPWETIPERLRRYMVDRIHLIDAEGPGTEADCLGLLAAGRLERLRCPTLILRGSRSPACMAPLSAALAARLPTAETGVVEGAGHMLPVTHPAEVAGWIARTLSRG